jgi:hypothetical protein
VRLAIARFAAPIDLQIATSLAEYELKLATKDSLLRVAEWLV